MLKWSLLKPPNGRIPYNHITAHSPVGEIVIEWKGWKVGGEAFTCTLPHDGYFCCGADLYEIRNLVQERIDQLYKDLEPCISK